MTPAYLALWQRRMQDALAGCDAFVASSESARRIVSDALPRVAARAYDFHVIPHGRDFAAFRPCAASDAIADGQPLRFQLPGNTGRHRGREPARQHNQTDGAGMLELERK